MLELFTPCAMMQPNITIRDCFRSMEIESHAPLPLFILLLNVVFVTKLQQNEGN